MIVATRAKITWFT